MIKGFLRFKELEMFTIFVLKEAETGFLNKLTNK